MKSDNGGPAFPVNTECFHNEGMTLWDYFAAAALGGLVAGLDMNISDTQIAEYSANFADAMLAEREKRGMGK